MYIRIEKEFKKKSKYRKSQLLFALGAFAYATVITLLFSSNFGAIIENNKLDSNFIWFLVVGIFMFPIICYIYMLLSIRKQVKITIENAFNYDFVRAEYEQMIHNKDLEVLSNILKDNNINTRPKVQEALRHYQCMLPRKVTSSGTLLSILAFTVSILALIFSETVFMSADVIPIILTIILGVILIYIIVLVITNGYFKAFCKDALYTRIEASLSEIFMNYYSKQDAKQEKKDD